MANDALNRYIEAAAGITQLTKARAQQIVKQLMQQTESVSGPATDLVDDLVERSRQNREALAAIVRTETNRAIKAMGLATRSEVERLQRQVTDLRRSASSSASSAGSTSSSTGAKKSSATTGAKRSSSSAKKSGATKKAGTTKKSATKKSSAAKKSSTTKKSGSTKKSAASRS